MFSGDRTERTQAMLPGKAEFESNSDTDCLCEFKPSFLHLEIWDNNAFLVVL